MRNHKRRNLSCYTRVGSNTVDELIKNQIQERKECETAAINHAKLVNVSILEEDDEKPKHSSTMEKNIVIPSFYSRE